MITNYSVYSLLFGVIGFFFMIILVNLFVEYYHKKYITNLTRSLGNIFININKNKLILYHFIIMFTTVSVCYVITNFIIAIISMLICFIVPQRILGYLEKRHSHAVIRQLPDVLSSMSAMLKAGTHFNKVLHIVASQHPAPISKEFKVVLSEYKLGLDQAEALTNMAIKIDRQELYLTVSAINIAQSVGGNLSDTFDTLSDTLREKIVIEGKIEALTAMGRMQGKVVSMIPILVLISLYYQDPQGMSQLLAEPYVWPVAVLLLAIIGLASLIIKKITTVHI